MQTHNDEYIQVKWVKVILYTLILIAIIVFLVSTPKKVFKDDLSYKLATSMAILDDSNYLLYDYQVYGSELRFNEVYEADLNHVLSGFKERNELLAVKVNGDTNSIEVRDNYIFIVSDETPELNIEYYLVKDMSINDITIPCRTFIMLFNDASVLVNTIYTAVYWVFFIIVFTPVTIKFTRSVISLKNHYHKPKIDKII